MAAFHKVKAKRNFDENASEILQYAIYNSSRVDVSCDTYTDQSVKDQLLVKYGKTYPVAPLLTLSNTTRAPTNWEEYPL